MYMMMTTRALAFDPKEKPWYSVDGYVSLGYGCILGLCLYRFLGIIIYKYWIMMIMVIILLEDVCNSISITITMIRLGYNVERNQTACCTRFKVSFLTLFVS